MSYGPVDTYNHWGYGYRRVPAYMRLPAVLDHVKIESPETATLNRGVNRPSDQGSALLARNVVPTTQKVCSVDRPAIAALDTPRLKDTCYTCYANAEEANLAPLRGSLRRNMNTENGNNEGEEGKAKIKLKLCTGCKVVKFCDRICQTNAWESHHKFECPIYAALQPRILPNNVRAVMRFLLQKQFTRLPDKLWDDVNLLESHINELRRAGGSRWENLVIMAQGTKEYSKTDQSFDVVLKLLCILMINSFTLMTAWNDPIGLCLHPLLARINHSCQPNSFIHFPIGRSSDIRVMPLRKIKKNEQITISYVDTTEAFEKRQEQLQQRYFFNCTCPKCVRDKSNTIPPQLRSVNVDMVEKRAVQLLESADESTSVSVRIERLRYALFVLEDSKEWPAKKDPYPRLLHKLILVYIDDHQFNIALAYAAIQHLDIDSELYEQEFHPTRLTHCLLLIRLMTMATDGENWTVQSLDLRPFGINLVWWRRYLLNHMQRALTKTNLPDLADIVAEENLAANRVHLYPRNPTDQDLRSDENSIQANKSMKGLKDWAYERIRQWKSI